ncbi:MAG: NAD(P)/FAD-dependent oxidoreductase [Actinobacteria bacterium]|nr:MAG: NAD(P)/FAD-dependent oxidoreductase [Actinomycetota bacterium]TMM21604.1 MAG: NAD(P)/FAD-dependent oxidoreductase [Actinomycetota bacterium]
MAANGYDAIIIGGGHNGLVSGAYFARDGLRTVVLEARNKTGGAADTSAPFADHPEINVTTYSYVMSLMPPTIIRELRLKEFGYDVTPFGPYFQAYPDGRAVTVYPDDSQRSYDSIAEFSKRDADTMPKWEAWLQGVADVMGPLMLHVPPHVGSMHPMDVLSTVQTAWKMRKLGERGVGDVTRLFTMSVSDLLNDWFESDAVKGMLTVNGVIGTWAGPDEPGTAYVMLHHSIGDVGDGHLGSWGFQQGGMGGVSTSIRTAAEAFGCEIRTGARVKKILVRNGRAVGVVLDDGQELRAPVVVSCIHPQIAFLDLIDRHELPPDFVWDIERWKTRSGVVKINVAISELPDFKAQPGKELQDLHTGSVELCFSSDYAEQAFQDAHLLRKPSVAPFVDGTIPTTLDKKLAPEGTHVFSMFTQWVPDDWVKEPHRDELDAYAKRIFDLYDELAPNFKDSIIDYQVIGPYDMEQELGLIGGNIFHGELSADQLFHMRPAPGYGDYRTPLKGLYHGSSATHAGGGVNGIPGWQAYRQAKKDRAVRSK